MKREQTKTFECFDRKACKNNETDLMEFALRCTMMHNTQKLGRTVLITEKQQDTLDRQTYGDAQSAALFT